MNIVDYILLALLLAMVIVGSKKGLVRELTAFFLLVPSVVVSIYFMDTVAVRVYESVGGSPMVVTFLSFIILIGVAYAVFKMIGVGIAKIIKFQKKGKTDQMGGAFIGFARGWIIMSFVFFLLFLLPMPASFYLAIENSLFGPTLVKTVPFLYEASGALHPNHPSFFGQVEKALTLKNSRIQVPPNVRSDVDLVLYQMHRFFNVNQAGT